MRALLDKDEVVDLTELLPDLPGFPAQLLPARIRRTRPYPLQFVK